MSPSQVDSPLTLISQLLWLAWKMVILLTAMAQSRLSPKRAYFPCVLSFHLEPHSNRKVPMSNSCDQSCAFCPFAVTFNLTTTGQLVASVRPDAPSRPIISPPKAGTPYFVQIASPIRTFGGYCLAVSTSCSWL